MPAFGAWDWLKLRGHLETAAFIVAPPAGETRQLPGSRVPFVDEASGDAAGTAVEIFVAAPDGEIRVPIMEMKRKVSRGVRHVETHDAALGVRGLGDARAVEGLSAVVIHSAK